MPVVRNIFFSETVNSVLKKRRTVFNGYRITNKMYYLNYSRLEIILNVIENNQKIREFDKKIKF